MSNRHLSRTIALQSLYQWDFLRMPEGKLSEIIAFNREEFAPKFDDEGFIEELIQGVVNNRPVIEQLIRQSQKTLRNGVTLGIIFFIIAIAFVYNTFRIVIRFRSDEIAVMRLVGATNHFILGPFLVEGALYGILGASISVFLIYVLLLFYSPQIQNFLGDIRVFPINPLFFLYLWAAEALAAALVGIIGAAIALYRYLKIR